MERVLCESKPMKQCLIVIRRASIQKQCFVRLGINHLRTALCSGTVNGNAHCVAVKPKSKAKILIYHLLHRLTS